MVANNVANDDVDVVITDVLAAANRTFQFRGADGKPMRLTDAVTEASCASYVLLNDSVVEQISVSLAPALVRAPRASAPSQGHWGCPAGPAGRRATAAPPHAVVALLPGIHWLGAQTIRLRRPVEIMGTGGGTPPGAPTRAQRLAVPTAAAAPG